MTIWFDMDDTHQIAAINYKHGFQEINGFLYQSILKNVAFFNITPINFNITDMLKFIACS